MGCTASKIDNEDTVLRCKERRRLMKEAVHSRHYLASAHSDYLHSLRCTGSALTRFAAGEPLSVSIDTSPVLLHTPNPPSSAASTLPPPTPLPTTPIPIPHPPPPHSLSPSPPTASYKLPHILSESSAGSTPFHKPSVAATAKYPRFPAANSTYSTTPSQASSVWDWENYYPPSPPDSDFFRRRKFEEEEENHHPPVEEEEEEEEYEEEENGRREDARRSEWGDHCSSATISSTKSAVGENEDEQGDSTSDGVTTRSDFGGSSSIYTPSRPAPSEIGSSASALGKSGRREILGAGSSSRWNVLDGGSARELKMVVRHRDLAEIVSALEEYFIRVASAGEPVSELLETGRAQFDRSFRQLKSEA